MADMQAGIGPFLGVFLLGHGWESGLIGTVMTLGGITGMLMTTPAGALIVRPGTKSFTSSSPVFARSSPPASFCFHKTFGW
ncbi:MAG: hypothetical protein ABI407_09745 [Bradyrhizobium sp.]